MNLDKKSGRLKSTLLFDDLNDPYQQHNLPVEENREIVAGLCAEMVPLLREANDPWYTRRILPELLPYDID